VAIAYGITFVSGLVLAFAGITPQTHHVAYPLLALLMGSVGVALALRAADTTRLSYLLAIGVGIWLLSSTSVLLGAQSFAGWVDSSVFTGITLLLGHRPIYTPRTTSDSDAQTFLARQSLLSTVSILPQRIILHGSLDTSPQSA
jgi:hypothetical protein